MVEARGGPTADARGRDPPAGERAPPCYLDSHFPWQRSGFRYADALALHAIRPDTVFFSMYAMRDPFPAPVLPLADFPRMAPTLGITDVYGVFLNFIAGIVGLGGPVAGTPPGPVEGLDLSSVIRREGLRVHAGVYPGGGLIATEASLQRVRDLVAAADQAFSWGPLVLAEVAGVVSIRPGVIDTTYYRQQHDRFDSEPLEILFAADDRPRKGLDVALHMMVELAGEAVHLHVVGPHDPTTSPGGADRVTFHGWLERDALRALHRRCKVFVSPVTAEIPGDVGGDGGVTDGFPTTAAAEAMSSGLLLISANPEGDHRHLRCDVDFIERPADPLAFADAVREVIRNPGHAATIAATGARRVRERFNVRAGVAERLALMGLNTPASRVIALRSADGSELD